jgi:hypothetical protein
MKYPLLYSGTVCFIFTFILSLITLAQPGSYIVTFEAQMASEHTPFTIYAEPSPAADIVSVTLMYRPHGETIYKESEMLRVGSRLETTIPASDAIPPFVEYYFLIESATDGMVTYPAIDPEFNPFIAPVRYRPREETLGLILSPDPNETVQFGDLLISVSVIDLPGYIDKQSSRMYIGSTDITEYALITDEVLLSVPANIPDLQLLPGRHEARIEYFDSSGAVRHNLVWEFSVSARAAPATVAPDIFTYNVSLRGESRNETIAGYTQWYNRSTLNMIGRLPWVRFTSNLHLTNEERSMRQPQNRYSLNADARWVRLSVGDTYPRFPSLIMNGRRLRGFSGSIELGYVNLDYATGQTIRRVQGRELYTMPADSVDMTGQPVLPPPNSRLIDDSTYAVFSYGTFARNLTMIRPSLGNGSPVQVGFTYLESKDDIGSVIIGNRPGQNLVLGSDITVSVDNRRFELYGQIAGSIQNTDISGGNLSREELDDLFGEGTVRDIERIVKLSTLQRYMTVNQYLIPLDPSRFSSVAYDMMMRLNYFGNYLQVGYIRRGNDYNSFGLTSLRRDIAGLQIRDRLRLYENQLYLDFSTEIMRDNLNDQKAFTTRLNNHNFSVSYFPRTNLPNMSVGYGFYKNNNKVDPYGPDGRSAISDVTNRVFTTLSHSFMWKIRHNGTFSATYSNRNDRTALNADVSMFNVSTMLNSYFETLPLQTSAGLGFYTSVIPLELEEMQDGSFRFRRSGFNYFNLILSGTYRLLENKLLVNAAWIPTFGDYNRIAFQTGAQYSFMKHVSLVYQMDYLVNPDARNDFISYLMIRYDL